MVEQHETDFGVSQPCSLESNSFQVPLKGPKG